MSRSRLQPPAATLPLLPLRMRQAAGRASGSCRSSRSRIAARPWRSSQRLSGKGYPAFLVQPPPAPRSQPIYKVQVGRFDDRARGGAGRRRRLEKEEQFKPWILALALLSGVLLALSFPKFGHPAFAWIALTPLIVALVAERRAAPARADDSQRLLPRPADRRRLLRRHALLARRDDDDVRRAADAAGGRRRGAARRVPVALSRRVRGDPSRACVRALGVPRGCCWRRAGLGRDANLAGSTSGTAFRGSCSATAR